MSLDIDIGDGQSTWAGKGNLYPEYALIPVRSYCSPLQTERGTL